VYEISKTKPVRVSKYSIIERDMLTKIREGLIPVGHQIPTEEVISKNYGVSRPTAQKAITSLASKGYLDRTPGKGTFVTEWRKEQNKKNVGRKDISALFVKIANVNQAFYMDLLHAASRTAEHLEYNVTFSGISDDMIVSGQMPIGLRENTSCGALIMGHVIDLHMKFFNQYKIPFLFVGNHRNSFGYPMISYDLEGMVRQLTSHLLETKKGPVWIVLEPFTLRTSVELYNGYQQAVFEHPNPVTLLNACPVDDCSQVVSRMLASGQEEFQMIVFHEHGQELLSCLRRAQIDLRRITMIVIGQRGPWWRYDGESNLMLCEYSGRELGEEAVRQMIDSFRVNHKITSKKFRFGIEKTENQIKSFKYSWK